MSEMGGVAAAVLRRSRSPTALLIDVFVAIAWLRAIA
jgi:hypothetical protein